MCVNTDGRHAQYSLGNFQEAATAFRRGVQLDPSNASLKSGLKNAEARIVPGEGDEPSLEAAVGGDPNVGAGLGGIADMLGSLGGGGGGGGMPDLASMINNPMMMQMAQQMAANGGLERLMQNPALANMVCDLYAMCPSALVLIPVLDEPCSARWRHALYGRVDVGSNHARYVCVVSFAGGVDANR